MPTRSLLLLALATACASSSEQPPESTPLEVRVEFRLPDVELALPTVVVETPTLSRCLQDGGRLIEVDAVDNNDVVEHGEIRAFDVAPDGRMAAATVDGTIKLWSLEGFVGELTPGLFAYGAELAATPSVDIAFFDDQVVAADVRGLVTSQSTDGLFEVLGGTTPDTSMLAVAVDSSRRRVAHADAAEGGNIHLRNLSTGDVRGPLASASLIVHDLAFTDSGSLIVAGAGDGALLERWGTGEEPDATWHSDDEIVEIATVAGVIVAVGPQSLHVLDGDLVEHLRIDAPSHQARSVELSPDARVFFSLGDEGVLRAWDTVNARELSQLTIPEPVSVRAEASGELVFVASRDGILRAISCE